MCCEPRRANLKTRIAPTIDTRTAPTCRFALDAFPDDAASLVEEGEASTRSAPGHQVHLTVCETCRRGWQNGAGRELEVSAGTVERACCDGVMLGRLDADPPSPATPTVSPRRRAQVLARDGHRCVVPGCRSARNLCIHHLIFQVHGGTNAMWNLATLCSGHHQALHDGLLSITGKAPDQLTHVGADASLEALIRRALQACPRRGSGERQPAASTARPRRP